MGYTRLKLLTIALLTEGVALTAALISAKWFGITLLPLTKNFPRDALIGAVGAVLPLAFFVCLLSGKADNVPLIRSLRKTVLSDVKAVFSPARFVDVVLISLIAGFAEELLFRGILQNKFGIIIASILFGLVHFVTPAYALIAALMGLYIGFFFHAYGSLLIPIQLHFVYDLGALTYLRYFAAAED